MKRYRLALALSLVLGAVVPGILMASRSPAGTYTLPSGNPVSTGQTITSSLWNTTHADIGTELTNSLDRSGRGSMTAPLQLTSGSNTAPGLTFASETNSGLYRAGAGDIRMQVNSTLAEKYQTSGVTIPGICTVQNGAAITTVTANGTGVTSTGIGTGNGVGATGGQTSGAGLFATGGIPNGNGVTAVGTGAGNGGTFTSATGEGVRGTGGTANEGIRGIGGSSDGTGVYGSGGATNGIGVKGDGAGSGAGGNFTGGASGSGVTGVGNGAGLGGVFTGGSAGAGVSATGGGTQAGGTFASGTASTGATPQSAIRATNGNISLVGTADPDATVGFTDTLTPKNLIKAWARYTLNASASPTVSGGFNVSSVSASSTTTTVTFATGLSAGNYACTATPSDVGFSTMFYVLAADTSSGSSVVITMKWAQDTGSITIPNPTITSGQTINVICTGAQ